MIQPNAFPRRSKTWLWALPFQKSSLSYKIGLPVSSFRSLSTIESLWRVFSTLVDRLASALASTSARRNGASNSDHLKTKVKPSIGWRNNKNISTNA